MLRAGNEVRITAQLIRGDSDEHIWAEHYDGNVENILKLQKDIALAIADQIQVAVTADERAQLRSAARIDPAAYDMFLMAARFGGNWSPASIQRSLEQFEEVARLAPDFGRVHTMKATAYFFLGMWGYAPSTKTFAAARRAARHALRLDDNDGGGHTTLAWLAMSLEWDWEEALYRFQRAMELSANNYFVYGGLGFWHAFAGRHDEAMRYALKGVEVDPNNGATVHNVAMMYFLSGDYARAFAKMREALTINKVALPALTDGALIGAIAGEHEAARELGAKALEIGGPQPHILAYNAYARAKAGDIDGAHALLHQLENYAGQTHVLAIDLATVYIVLGRTDDALDALDRAQREREYSVALIGKSPVFDPLRDHPRFQALIKEIDFPTT